MSSRPPGCSSSSTWMISKKPAPWKPPSRASPTPPFSTPIIAGPPGRSQGCLRCFRSQLRPHRARLDRLRKPTPRPPTYALSRAGPKAQTDRIQDRGNLQRNRQQVPKRLLPTRCPRTGRLSTISFPATKARALRPLRRKDQTHGQCRAQRGRILHPTPSHPGHGQSHQPPHRGTRGRPRLRIRRFPMRSLRPPPLLRPHCRPARHPPDPHPLR